ncbi:MAG TPA: hypothetical protein VHE30_26640 [Polyangiaceae bacterium]|nr:hypothetical protein [Polyangiaceae bacterium]
MKSSDPRLRRAQFFSLALAFFGALGIAFLRPLAAERFRHLKVTADVYPLASPEQTVVMSLGYRAALADAIFAHVLVSYGLHAQEKRKFEFAGQYLDTVNALDPKFRDPYRFADTIITLGTGTPRVEDFLKAREIFRRGLRERPSDTELWMTAGQFMAYLAAGNLPTQAMRDEFRLEGAKLLAHACELVNDNENVPYQCIAAARLLENAGQREAAIDSLRRMLVVQDDPNILRLASGYLSKHLADREAEQRELRRLAFRDAWKTDLPFVSKNGMLALLPRVDTWRCAGPGHEDDPDCATSWRDWAERNDPTKHARVPDAP